MNKFSLGATFLALSLILTASADAADAGKQPQPNWTGIYVGAHVGGAWGRSDWSFNSATGPVNDRSPGNDTDHKLGGFVGGGQIGFNYHLGPLVLGFEPLYSGGNVDGSSKSRFGAGDDKYSTEVDRLFLVTGRTGYAWGRWLPYFRAGYAAGKVNSDVKDVVGPFAGTASASPWQRGYTVGGGLEYLLVSNVVLGAEYNFVNLGDRTHFRSGSDGGFISDDVNVRLHRMMVRLSYLFNWN